ncbi:hypothetical protein ACSAZK_13550 [Methanosarcina sp. Mfa9]|uniref:hypothetical protein n=1 Tax=Methanosarcina sp. Mfa9 TaxID=3439063 RepID=UPI003F82FF7F
MNDSGSEVSSEKTGPHSFLCFLGLHKWKRKSGALSYLPKVVEKRYECVRCGKSRVTFEKTTENKTLKNRAVTSRAVKSRAVKSRAVRNRAVKNESY